MVANIIDLRMASLTVSGCIRPSVYVNADLDYFYVVSFTEERDIRVIDHNNHIRKTWIVPRRLTPLSDIVLSKNMVLFSIMQHEETKSLLFAWNYNDKLEHAKSVPVAVDGASVLLMLNDFVGTMSKSAGHVAIYSQTLELLCQVNLGYTLHLLNMKYRAR